MSQTGIVLACIALGAATGRRWALHASLPIGVAAGLYFDFEGMTGTEEGVLVGVAAAASIAAGMAARVVVARVAKPRGQDSERT